MTEQLYRAIARFNIRGQSQKIVHYVKPRPKEHIRARYVGDKAFLDSTSGELQLIPVNKRVPQFSNRLEVKQ